MEGKKIYKSVACNVFVHLHNLVYDLLVATRESLEGGGINDSLVIDQLITIVIGKGVEIIGLRHFEEDKVKSLRKVVKSNCWKLFVLSGTLHKIVILLNWLYYGTVNRDFI